MERNFYNEEFEQFLKQKSDQYKMYPSDRVWGNIYSSLHNRRRWMGLGILLLLISSALMVSREVLLNNYSQVARKVNQDLFIPTSSSTLSTNNATLKNDPPANNIKSFKPQPGIYPSGAAVMPIARDAAGMAASKEPVTTADNNTALQTEMLTAESQSLVIENNMAPRMVVSVNQHKPLFSQTEKIKLKQDAEKKTIRPDEENDQNSVIRNTYNGNIGLRIPSKWSLQLYASPIVSYRRLTNLNRSEKYVPVAINYSGNIDNYVHHKPALGFEIGTKIQYKLSNSLHLYAGAQLNYSRYYIDAYNYHSERATIALNASPVPDTLANYTSIRNFAGYSPEQLQNQYFQVSVPIGAELKLLGNERLQLSIAGAIQPTYLISSSSYLISSDYKNYIQNPDLARRFNIHTNLEAFVSYRLGGLKWQLGPQFRYQLLSSYSNKYPIREYLTEFGIKLGITKTIK